MKRVSLITILALVLFTVLGLLFRANVANAIRLDPKPSPTIVTNPNTAKYLGDDNVLANTLAKDKCDPNGGLASKSCKGYRLPEVYTDALMALYQKDAARQCTFDRRYDPYNPPMPPDDNPVNYFRCIFGSANNLCFKYVQVHNELGTDGGLPWTKMLTIKNANGTYTCTYCRNGQATNATTPNGTKYCTGNLDWALDVEDPIMNSGQLDVPYFCVNIPVSGPYSNLPDDFTACEQSYTQGVEGAEFTQTQKDDIKALNRMHFTAPANTNKSDLAGFCFPRPPSGCHPGFQVSAKVCREPDAPQPSPTMQVHHIVPRSAGNSCPCGTNSPKNAMVISAKLNNYFSNKDLATLKNLCDKSQTELDVIPDDVYRNSVLAYLIVRLNKVPKYDVSPLKKSVKKKVPTKKPVRSKTRK